ncbi:MAG TPA: hypothetical protein VHY58_04005 [Streptosporangiaceae bacterium]|nr:hypothetical protein [Streptosporangiaceae bacterium]
MNTMEDRLRDAYEAAAQTVLAESVLAESVLADGVRGLHGHRRWARGRQAHPHAKRGRSRGRLLIPFAAAVAVIAVVAGTTVLTQRTGPAPNGTHRRGGPAAAEVVGTPGYFVALNWTTHPSMFVVNAATGAKGQTITLPSSDGNLVGVATGDGRTFVAATIRRGPCVTHLYKFGLSSAGQPTALTASGTVPGVVTPWTMAVAGNGQMVAYDTVGCAQPTGSSPGSPPVRQTVRGALDVVNFATGQTKHWSYAYKLSDQNEFFGGVSLSEDGSSAADGAWVVPTSAPDGPLTARGRMVAHPGEFGSSTIANGLELAGNGKAAYFGTFLVKHDKPAGRNWQLRKFNLVTGRTSLVRSFPGTMGTAGAAACDPTGRYLLAEYLPHLGTGVTRVARLDLATGKVTQLNATWAVEAAIAW